MLPLSFVKYLISLLNADKSQNKVVGLLLLGHADLNVLFNSSKRVPSK